MISSTSSGSRRHQFPERRFQPPGDPYNRHSPQGRESREYRLPVPRHTPVKARSPVQSTNLPHEKRRWLDPHGRFLGKDLGPTTLVSIDHIPTTLAPRADPPIIGRFHRLKTDRLARPSGEAAQALTQNRLHEPPGSITKPFKRTVTSAQYS
ncbi:MAG: hypothetical protein CM1200mP41_14150 [Gammaproteobacteria bacterium]|nr:MAG: hypothetical protein CM1200mP41_14150 [Gammaproteobacteria bacterium]